MTLLKGRTFIVLVLLVIFFTIVKGTTFLSASTPVSYTHLDVYKRQVLYCIDEDGNQYMIDNLKKDSVFGEPFLLPEESQHYYVCAKSETRVLYT